jgi:hypothetical protein
MSGILFVESAGDVAVWYWNPVTCSNEVVREAVSEALQAKNEAVRECLDEGRVICDPNALPVALRNVPVAQWGKFEGSPVAVIYHYR